jgi:flavin-binding protein dodecin
MLIPHLNDQRSKLMGNTYKKIELTGTSSKSIEEAVGLALQKASDSVRNMRWFEVLEVRGAIDGHDVSEWQVTVKVGFTVE